jgi:hypothetical protein
VGFFSEEASLLQGGSQAIVEAPFQRSVVPK